MCFFIVITSFAVQGQPPPASVLITTIRYFHGSTVLQSASIDFLYPCSDRQQIAMTPSTLRSGSQPCSLPEVSEFLPYPFSPQP